MVDSMNPMDAGAPLPEPTDPPKSGLAGFLSTTTGKLVVGGVALLIVVAAVGAILFLFVFQSGSDSSSLVPTGAPKPSAVASGTAGASEDTSPTERKVEPLTDTFSFRDIFVPTVKPAVESTSTTSSAGASGTVDPTAIPENTLYLVSVQTVDGAEVATLIWNGTTYEVGEGDQLDGTPWQVLQINGSSVVMLYGDSQVTLTVGQALETK